MRKILIMFISTFSLGCTNGKVDENKLDAAGDKLQKTVEKGADSIGSKLERLKDKIDSTNKDTVNH